MLHDATSQPQFGRIFIVLLQIMLLFSPNHAFLLTHIRTLSAEETALDLRRNYLQNEYSLKNINLQNHQHRSPSIFPPLMMMSSEGETMIMTEENVELCLEGARAELGTLFGYSAENRNVGITGEVDFVELDGPIIVLRLSGRFWHERSVVLSRLANYITIRIPECVEVTVEDPSQLLDD
mmetsp:Transcript_16258/g.21535  ORF Transcript_16258/g.21535 Transcript_16258/m.21535 type:complete len:180 (+) Transcript_16258:48-587(+)